MVSIIACGDGDRLGKVASDRLTSVSNVCGWQGGGRASLEEAEGGSAARPQGWLQDSPLSSRMVPGTYASARSPSRIQ